MSLANELLQRRELSAILEDASSVVRLKLEGYQGPEIETLRESVSAWTKQCESLKTHVARSPKPEYISYSGLLTVLSEKIERTPTGPLLRLLESHANHSKVVMRRVLETRPHEQYLEHAINELGVALLEGSASERFKPKHSSFLKKLEAEYEVSPEFVEYLNEGVFITVSREDHQVLRDSSIREFANQNNYILIKRGDPGQEEIKWGFVFCGTLGGTERLSEGKMPSGWADLGSPFMKGGKWYVSARNRTTLEEGQYCFESNSIIKKQARSRRVRR